MQSPAGAGLGDGEQRAPLVQEAPAPGASEPPSAGGCGAAERVPDGAIRSSGATSFPCVARRTPRSFSTTAGTWGSSRSMGIIHWLAPRPSASTAASATAAASSNAPARTRRSDLEMGAAAEARPQLVRQRTDVEAGRAAHAQARQSVVVRAERQVADRDRDRAKLHGLVAAGQLVGRHPVDFLGGVGRRHLRVRAAKLVERRGRCAPRRCLPARAAPARRGGRRRTCRSRRRGGRPPRIPSRWR